jgi:hypothetical protein
MHFLGRRESAELRSDASRCPLRSGRRTECRRAVAGTAARRLVQGYERPREGLVPAMSFWGGLTGREGRRLPSECQVLGAQLLVAVSWFLCRRIQPCAVWRGTS